MWTLPVAVSSSANVGPRGNQLLLMEVHIGPVRLQQLVPQRAGSGPVAVVAEELHA